MLNTTNLDALVAGAAAKLTCVKDLPPYDVLTGIIHGCFHPANDADSCRTLVLYRAQGFAYFHGASGELREVICPKTVQGNTFWGSANDRFAYPSPVAFATEPIGTKVISVAREELAVACEAHYLRDAQYSPSIAPSPGSQEPAEDIHWPSGDGVFVAVPLVYPIYPGATIPSDLKLQDDLPANFGTLSDHFRLWCEAMKYLYDFNEMKSLHTHGNVFDVEAIPQDRFTNCTLTEDIRFETHAVNNYAAEHHIYVSQFEGWRKDTALKYLTTTVEVDVTPDAAAQAPGHPAPNAFDPARFATDIATALKTSTTSTKDRDQARTSAAAQNFYCLFFAKVKPTYQIGGDSIDEVHPALLTEDFLTFLNSGSTKDSVSFLQESYQGISDSLRTRNDYDRNVDFNIGVFQHATVSALKSCAFGVRPLNLHPNEATHLLSLLAWLPPAQGDTPYTTFIADGTELLRQEAMDEDKSKIATKKTNIFIHGDLSSVEALIKMLANFFTFAKYCVKDFTFDDPPLIVALLEEFMDSLHNSLAKDWVRHHTSIDHLPLCLLLEMNHILQVVVGVAKHKDTQKQLTLGHGISGTVFTNAYAGKRRAIENIQNSITMGTLGPYSTRPRLADTLLPRPMDQSPDRTRNRPPADHLSRPPDRRDPPKRPKPDQSGQPGYLIYTGQGRLPIPPLKCTHPVTGKSAPFCALFLFQGFKCNHARNCFNIHYTIAFAATMTAPETRAFDKFIADNPAIKRTRPRATG